jgi:hypothetical protein
MDSIQTAHSLHLAQLLEVTQGLLVLAVAALSGAICGYAAARKRIRRPRAVWLAPAVACVMNLVALACTDAWAAGTGSGPPLDWSRWLARLTVLAIGVGLVGAVPAALAAWLFQTHARPGAIQ